MSIGDVIDALISDVPEDEWDKLPKDFASSVDRELYGVSAMTDLEATMLGDLEQRIEILEHPPTLHERLRHMAWWVRIDAPLLPSSDQMAEFADAAKTLDALAEEARELENKLARSGIAHQLPEFDGIADVLET